MQLVNIMQFGVRPLPSGPLARKLEAREREVRKEEARQAMVAAEKARLETIRRAEELETIRLTKEEATCHSIIKEVARKHGLSPLDLKPGNRVRKYVLRSRKYILARQEASYRFAAETKYSLTQIARLMGGAHHTTVLHHIRQYVKRNRVPAPRNQSVKP